MKCIQCEFLYQAVGIIIIIIIIINLYAGGSTHYCGFQGGPENKINGITK